MFKTYEERNLLTAYLLTKDGIIGFIDTSDINPLVGQNAEWETMAKVNGEWLEFEERTTSKAVAIRQNCAVTELLSLRYDAIIVYEENRNVCKALDDYLNRKE